MFQVIEYIFPVPQPSIPNSELAVYVDNLSALERCAIFAKNVEKGKLLANIIH